VPTKFWEPHLRGSWILTRMRARRSDPIPDSAATLPRDNSGIGRRMCLAFFGLLIGFGAIWITGSSPRWVHDTNFGPSEVNSLGIMDDTGVTGVASYLSYFALTLGAVRWWRMTDRRRRSWFSLFPVLATGFWALLFGLVFWPTNQQPMFGAAALVMASAIVQWVSPWEPPPPPPPKRLRLRYA
jgi:eukaryotic-like serine/threonine-protein kinase